MPASFDATRDGPRARGRPTVLLLILLAMVFAGIGDAEAEPRQNTDALWSGQLYLSRTIALESAPAAEGALLDRIAVVPLRNGRVKAVNLETGAEIWTTELATSLGLAAGDGLVFATTADAIVAIGADGARRWSVAVPGGFSAALAWDGGWLIASTSEREVLALRADDGHVLWTSRVPAAVVARPALGHDRVYLALDDGHVVALNLSTGAPAWQYRLGGRPGAPLATPDRIFVGASDRWFYCLSATDGKRKWRWRHGGLITAAPAVDTRHVYLTGYNNVLRALDRSGGSQRWMRGLPIRPLGGPLVLNDVVAVAGIGGEVRTYRTTRTGDPAGEFAGTSDLAVPPMLAPHPVPELTGVVLLTRSGDLQVLRRPLSITVVPLMEMFGVQVPLGAPPTPP